MPHRAAGYYGSSIPFVCCVLLAACGRNQQTAAELSRILRAIRCLDGANLGRPPSGCSEPSI
eukprot:SAG22_NODE_370_length_11576_cov_83.771456_5_plen_62_part_00